MMIQAAMFSICKKKYVFETFQVDFLEKGSEFLDSDWKKLWSRKTLFAVNTLSEELARRTQENADPKKSLNLPSITIDCQKDCVN